MKILLLPDSFKGTMSSIEVCQIIQSAFKKETDDEIIAYPFGDGGENTLDCFEYVLKDSQKIKKRFTSPYSEKKESGYLVKGNTAIIESAKVIGLQQENKRNPLIASTYGLGEMIKDALDHKVSSIIITLGGSCTNDGGAGMLCALGMKFYDSENKPFIPTGGTLAKIQNIDVSQLDKRLEHCRFTLLSDVNNPLLGNNGASFVFARQKGADDAEIPVLEENMKAYSEKIQSFTHKDIVQNPGMGAAGGLSFAFASFFDYEICSGAKKILELYKIEDKIDDIDLIITGEGRTDISSFDGKCIQIVSGLAKRHAVKVLLISGYIEKDVIPKLKENGIEEYISIQENKDKEFAEIRKHAKEDLYDAVVKYIRDKKACSI